MTFSKAAAPAHDLSDLPNISFVLGAQLKKLGITSPAELRATGAETAWLAVQRAGGIGSIHVLLALEGAIQNVIGVRCRPISASN